MFRNRMERVIMVRGSTTLFAWQRYRMILGIQVTMARRYPVSRHRRNQGHHPPFDTVEPIHCTRNLAAVNADVVKGAIVHGREGCHHLASLPRFEGGAQPPAEWAIGDRFGDVRGHRDRHVSFRSCEVCNQRIANRLCRKPRHKCPQAPHGRLVLTD